MHQTHQMHLMQQHLTRIQARIPLRTLQRIQAAMHQIAINQVIESIGGIAVKCGPGLIPGYFGTIWALM